MSTKRIAQLSILCILLGLVWGTTLWAGASPVPLSQQSAAFWAINEAPVQANSSPSDGYEMTTSTITQTVYLNQLHGWPESVGNHVKIFDVAVDSLRNRVYVQGSMSSGIAIIDGETDELIGQVESGIDTFHRTYLAVDPNSGALFVADYFSRTLRRINPDTGAITGPVTLSGRPEHILFDPSANRVYLTLRQAHKIAVYDSTTLALVGEMDATGAAPQGMALSADGSRLYVVDAHPPRNNRSSVLVFDTATLAPLPSITFSNATHRFPQFLTQDPTSGDLFITTPEDLFRISSTGTVRWRADLPNNAKIPVYDAESGNVYVVSRDGISRTRSTIAAMDAATGAEKAIIDLGTGGAQRLAFNAATGKLYTPGMNTTDVVVVDTEALSVTARIDVGNTVEDIAIAPANGTAYFANRLGGSTVIAYRPDTGEWAEFATGGWPTAVGVDPALNRLFVLSHFDGTVAAYDLQDPLHPQPVGVASLGLQDDSDAITRQTLDLTRHLVVTAHPEHDTVVIVDGQTMRVTATIEDVPSFSYDPFKTKSRGHLQPAVEETQNKLYIFVPSTMKVDVFDGNNGYAYLGTIDLGSYGWKPAFNDFQIWADSARHRVYVGSLIIDTTTDRVIGRLPPEAGQMVVGVDEARDLLYTVGQVSAPVPGRSRKTVASADVQIALYALDRDTYTVQQRRDLRPYRIAAPYFALDAARGRFFAGYMVPALVDIYPVTAGEPTPSPTPTPTPTPDDDGITGAYLMTFLACDSSQTDCAQPANHRVYLAQSDDGADWSLVPGWTPYPGSVPDVIRRGDTLYVYTPGFVRRYHFSTGTWETPIPVTLEDPNADGFVDPSLIVDREERLVLFYLPGILGQDPAGCPQGESSCVKHFRSATEVPGSDGTHFVVDPGDRARVSLTSPATASDPDIFYDGARYILYIARGPQIHVYASDALRGTYEPLSQLPNRGMLTDVGAPASGYYNGSMRQYWTYVNNRGTIYRAVHTTLDASLTESDFVPVINGEKVGLGTSYAVGSPGFAVNDAGAKSSPSRLILPLLFHR